jgi:hypothetical protein
LTSILRTTRDGGSYVEIKDENYSDRWQRFGSYALTLVVTLRLLFVSLRPLSLALPWMYVSVYDLKPPLSTDKLGGMGK